MKSADFAYHRPSDIAEAVRCLQDYDGGARVLAGGQSLMPMMNMRLWRPDALVDINGLSDLAQLTVEGDETRIGALVRYTTLEFSPLVAERLPLIKAMVAFVGDRQVRNRGTVGGSLVQGDPTGEMPLGCLLLGATVSALGPSGARTIAMGDLYEGAYATTLAPDEVLTEIRFPEHPPHFAFRECCRRHNDFCVLSVAATGRVADDGRWSGLRIGLGGVNDTPVLAKASMALLEGGRLDDADIAATGQAALQAIDPPDDIRGSAEYRAHLVPLYVARVLRDLRASALAAAQ
ncbi:MAG: xanthine dehydrogenase family protein subunit M [Rhodospirillales bacterium]|nr:xanthine dehydrogenase family protein subunit M [Rhodospirillales bacterium]